jgi:hypothetical protein
MPKYIIYIILIDLTFFYISRRLNLKNTVLYRNKISSDT